MSYVDPYEDEEPHSSNYLVRQWKGQNALPYAYWVNGSIVTLTLAGISVFVQRSIEGSETSLQVIAASGLALILLMFAAWIWSAVGIWRSATRHRFRGGSASWGVIAKVMVIFGCLGMGIRLPDAYLQVRELGQLAAGSDPLGESASLTVRDPQTLQIDGFLTQGIAARVAAHFAANPGARVLILKSPGGRLIEAERIAAQVKARGMDTVAEGECASACLMPFLAGKSRLIGVNARLGFHQPSFPGQSPAEHDEGIRHFRDYLNKAGVDPGFANQALSAAPDDMWYPDLAALVRANVVTGLDRRAIEADNAQSAKALAAQAPKQLDPYTRMTGARADGLMLEYLHQFTLPASQLNIAQAKGALIRQVTANMCADPSLALMIQSGAVYRYSYSDSRGAPALRFDVNKCDVGTIFKSDNKAISR